MNDHEDDLDLKALWQSTPPIDLNELLRHVASERRRMRNLLWFETVGCVLGVGIIWFYYHLGVLGNLSFALLFSAAAIACQVWMWMWRRGQWSAVSEAPMDLLELQLRRARTGLRVGRYYFWGTPIAAAIGFMMASLPFADGTALEMPAVARAVIITALLAMLAGLTWFGWRLIHRARMQIQTLTSRIRAMRNGDG